jgi:Domain of unknown function (DUF4105)
LSIEAKRPAPIARIFGGVIRTLAWLAALGCAAWAFGALWFDLPFGAARRPVATGFLVIMALAVFRVRGAWEKICVLFAAFIVVAASWFSLKPRNDRRWQPDVDRTARAELNGDEITLYNVRNCDYRTETDYTPRWEMLSVRLSQLTGIDLAINYWGSPYMAHPSVSFQFADAPPVCFSIETRKEIGESYSAIGGLYRQYELIYIVADERDVIRVRTNFRKGEDVYLYHLTTPPPKARERFMDYITALNELHERPRWYNAATTNCTTSIRTQHAAAERAPWDWRILINGKGDELLFERGALATGGLDFPHLKKQAIINPAAQAANNAPNFSRRIREGRAGFGAADEHRTKVQ